MCCTLVGNNYHCTFLIAEMKAICTKHDDDDNVFSHDPLVLCAVTSGSSYIVGLSQDAVGGFPTPGPHPSLASVQQPAAKPLTGLEGVVHTVGSNLPVVSESHALSQAHVQSFVPPSTT